MRKAEAVATRFFRYVEPMMDDAGCWIWSGIQRGGRYGQIGVEGRATGTHRVSWELHFGAIPAGLFVCHRCDNPICVNPSHLFLGTAADNAADRDRKGRYVIPYGIERAWEASRRDVCFRGHARTIENVDAQRRCKPCRRAA